MSELSFTSLPLSSELLGNLNSLEYFEMTPVQAQTLPLVLAGTDIIAQSETGSGKTAVFGLGILHSLDPASFTTQALVLCPTRELAAQVATEIRRLARSMNNIKIATLCGGSPIKRQIDSLKHGVHIVIGTPGRIEDHLRRQTIELGNLKTYVLDEADRMLDMGFEESIDKINAQLPTMRQSLLFSATFPAEIQQIAAGVLSEPTHIKVETVATDANIAQHFYETTEDKRLSALIAVLAKNQPDSCIVFCKTRAQCKEVQTELEAIGFSALALHGDMEQRDRDQTLIRFANRSVNVLVATDVAARGLDINQLDAVINFEIPPDPETYIHRIGRTGRAGNSGSAYTLITDSDGYRLQLISESINDGINPKAVPTIDKRSQPARPAPMVTLLIQGGKKQKIRPGDILGALTGEDGIDGNSVGKINVLSNHAYVAVTRKLAGRAIEKLKSDKIKGRSFRIRSLG